MERAIRSRPLIRIRWQQRQQAGPVGRAISPFPPMLFRLLLSWRAPLRLVSYSFEAVAAEESGWNRCAGPQSLWAGGGLPTTLPAQGSERHAGTRSRQTRERVFAAGDRLRKASGEKAILHREAWPWAVARQVSKLSTKLISVAKECPNGIVLVLPSETSAEVSTSLHCATVLCKQVCTPSGKCQCKPLISGSL